MIKIDPIELVGIWDKGFALDYHTIKSVPIGEDPFGHMRYDTTYTPIGELLKKFKYKNQYDCVYDIVDTIMTFLYKHPDMSKVQSVLPVPPSNKNRIYQPVSEIAELLANRLDTFYSDDVLEKMTDVEFKTLSSSEKKSKHGMIVEKKKAKRKIDVLLVDDIYQSGSTIIQCTEVLRKDPNIGRIFVLTVTKTRKE